MPAREGIAGLGGDGRLLRFAAVSHVLRLHRAAAVCVKTYGAGQGCPLRRQRDTHYGIVRGKAGIGGAREYIPAVESPPRKIKTGFYGIGNAG